MRYLKLASAKNPFTDFIELNDLQGFLCTSFQSIGISRSFEFLAIKNRNIAVENKTNFKKYNLIIEILTKYSEYEKKHRELITFLDRNKKDGFRLYFRPYNDMELRYCLCEIENSERVEKMQPINLTLYQSSLWYGEENKVSSSATEQQEGNVFEFGYDENTGNYSAKFLEDENIEGYYSIAFYNGMQSRAEIENKGYNEIPLTIRIYGASVNPTISLFKQGEYEPIRQTQVIANINEGYYLEINANILESGVWLVNQSTGERIDYTELVNNEFGSPFFYIDNGKYYITIVDDVNNVCLANISWKEEYSE